MGYSLRAKDKKILKQISDFAKKKGLYLYIVGGYIRDIVLKREKENPDIDFSLKSGAIRFGRELSKKIRCGFVVLDKEHGCCRLVKKEKDKIYTLDFADFRSKTLEDDLRSRDFTMNSIAVNLEQALKSQRIDKLFIDPYGGFPDLKRKLIKAMDGKNFDDDPLRILRAFSLASIFDFSIDKRTFELIEKKKNKLTGVSSERIRDELFKILDNGNAADYLSFMDRLGILKLIIPEIEGMRNVKQGPYHHLDVLDHAFETVRQFEIIITRFKRNKNIRDYLYFYISYPRRRLALIKLACLLHDVGKPQALRHKNGKIVFYGHERIGYGIAKITGKQLKLSNDELEALKKMIFWHLRPGYMADNLNLTERAKFRYFRDTAGDAIAVLLLSLADQRATRGPLTSEKSRSRHEKLVSNLIRQYFTKQKEKPLIKLINGDDLIKRFKLSPSPLIGKILSEIEELQAAGELKTKSEALQAAEKIIRLNDQEQDE